MKTLIIIPAHNESASIKRVVNELTDNYPEYDYVVINDGSSDRTSRICKENDFNLISLPLNVGLSDAFRTGMKFAYRNGYDCALQLDGDGQHDPAYIGKMLKVMEENKDDIVIGSRFIEDKKERNIRSAGNSLISFLIKMTTGATINDSTSGMRLYGRRMIRLFSQYINYRPEPDTLAFLIRCGAKVQEVQVKMRMRTGGTSYFHWEVVIKYMVKICSSILFFQWFRKKEIISDEF